MNSKVKKYAKRFIIGLSAIGILAIILVYLILEYRLKNVLEYVVKTETNGVYEISFSESSLDLRKGNIGLKDATLQCIKPDSSKTSYKISIPDIYFSLDSWADLLLHKKMTVDSLHIVSPEINIFNAGKNSQQKATDTVAHNPYNILKEITQKLGIRALNIEEASIGVYYADTLKPPFLINHFNLKVANFKERDEEVSQFLSADDIDIFIYNQDWKFPNGNSMLFKQLHFSGKTQYFQIDSCHFFSASNENRNKVELTAEKLLVTSHELASLYQKNELHFDTLSFIHPVLQLNLDNKKNPEADTTNSPNEIISRLFADFNVKYINIQQGQIALNFPGKGNAAYTSDTTNLKIFDLNINRNSVPHLSIRNIELHLNEVKFSTPDSLYILSINDFGLLGNNLICKEASFTPTAKNKIGSGLTLLMPQFVLYNVSIADLAEKKLKASSALLTNPKIKIKGNENTTGKANKTGGGLSSFYHTLNGLAQLINVDMLNIQNGGLEYKTYPSLLTNTTLNKIDASILMHDFLLSDSLLDIKKSIPSLKIAEIKIASPKLNAAINKFEIKGSQQLNYIESIAVNTSSGMSLKGEHLFWQKFNWDKMFNSNQLIIDSVDLKKLIVSIKQETNKSAGNNKKSLPEIYLRKSYFHEMAVSLSLRNGSNILAGGNNIKVSALSNDENAFTWHEARGNFKNITYKKGKAVINIGGINFENTGETVINNILFEKEADRVKIPEIQFKANINSLDFSAINLNYLFIHNPIISINAKKNKNIEPQKSAKTKDANFNVGKLKINDAEINYFNKTDTLTLTTKLDFDADTVLFKNTKNLLLRYSKASANIEEMHFNNQKINVSAPELSLHLGNGNITKNASNKLSIESALLFQWKNISLDKRSINNTVLHVDQLSGNITDNNFSLKQGEKFSLTNLVDKINIRDGQIHYANNNISIDADKLKWNNPIGDFEISNFKMTPAKEKDEFFKASKWQKDFLLVSTDKININQLNTAKLIKDTALYIREISILNPNITTSRNKNIPFQHGIEKLMPTKLISTIKRPLRIDSIILKNAGITANEISNVTQREGTIPLVAINAIIKNITNRFKENDSLSIRANGILLDHFIRSVKYKESYADSLSGFRMSLRMSPMNLTALSKVTNPLAAVSIEKGKSDTLVAHIAGNKYAAFGEMNFFTADLRSAY